MAGKWLQLLKEIAPETTHAVLLLNPDTALQLSDLFLKPLMDSGRSLGVIADYAPVHNVDQIETALKAINATPGGGLVVCAEPFTAMHRGDIIALAERYKLPAVYSDRISAEKGGLLSYGIDAVEPFRQAASYVDRILRGVKPADLPVQLPTKFELIINLKTAKALGLKVPQLLLGRANEVIE
jgi:putative ABC transport system substrate-binding protein